MEFATDMEIPVGSEMDVEVPGRKITYRITACEKADDGEYYWVKGEVISDTGARSED